MAADHLLNTNPCIGFIEGFKDAPQDIKDNANAKLKSASLVWMDMWENYLKAGQNVPADLIGFVADIARKNREKVR